MLFLVLNDRIMFNNINYSNTQITNKRIIILSSFFNTNSKQQYNQNEMNSLKNIFKANLAKQPLDVVFWGEPTFQTFKQALLVYQSSTRQGKIQIQQRALRKLNKYKSPKICLSILCLLNMIMNREYAVCLPQISPNVNTQGCKSEKERIAEIQFIRFYWQFLQMHQLMPSDSNNFELLINYCENAVARVLKLVQYDFVITHCLDHLEHKTLSNIVMHLVMEKVSFDLQIIKDFVERHWEKIMNKNQQSFRVNYIYQKAINISKQGQKLEMIKRKSLSKVELRFYKLSPEINKRIEKEMLSRDSQKKQFISEKQIHLKLQQEDKIGSCPQLLDEDCLLMEDF